jgi:GT2 family glycosyltransferase
MSYPDPNDPQAGPEFPLVYLVTVNWNRHQDTLECLDSLLKVDYPNLRLLAVDNGSSDGSAQAIADRYPQVELICHESNLGFAGGYNSGMRHALQNGADYILILNNDATLATQSVSALLRRVSPGAGILSPVIYYAHQDEIIWSAGGKINAWTLEQSSTLQDQPDPGEWPDFIEQDFVTGCCMLFPRQTLQKVGLFDESFQLYYEDSDLCRRVRQAGLGIRVVPEARAWHKVARSSGGSNSPNERYWMARSSIRFFRKHARGLQIPAILFWRLGSSIRTTLRLAGQRNWQSLRAYWRGLRDGLRD